jgi:hypothetical protein
MQRAVGRPTPCSRAWAIVLQETGQGGRPGITRHDLGHQGHGSYRVLRAAQPYASGAIRRRSSALCTWMHTCCDLLWPCIRGMPCDDACPEMQGVSR